MAQLTKMLAMVVLLISFSWVTAGAYNFSDVDGNWWTTSGGATFGRQVEELL